MGESEELVAGWPLWVVEEDGGDTANRTGEPELGALEEEVGVLPPRHLVQVDIGGARLYTIDERIGKRGGG